jgi:GT2 family glycosyltransferase
MRLDIIIPTFNRSALLRKALDSVLTAERPADLEVRITVVDNNSRDDTRAVVSDYEHRTNGLVRYLFEPVQGRSRALNHGIQETSGELIGVIDDDEHVDPRWLCVVRDTFRDPDLEFIGGPYRPEWSVPPPEWLPMDRPGVIGVIDAGNSVQQYGPQFPGILMGGNVALRRSVLDRVGLFAEHLGRTGSKLLSGEDEDLYQRLLAAGARGQYRPDLIIYHHIPSERLTKRYFRQWTFWQATSWAMFEPVRPQPVPHLLGIPRYLFGRAWEGIRVMAANRVRRRDPADVFSKELTLWDLAGFAYGRYFYGRRMHVAVR